MIPKQLDQITEADLRALVDEQVREGLRLEYKRQLPPDDDGKRLLLKAVCSLANTQGGDLVVGVEVDPDDKSLPVAVPGVAVSDVDGEILRIQQVARSGLEPALEAPFVQPVSLASGNHAFVVRVQQSWKRPHRGRRERHFYGRTSAGAYPLEVAEVRRAFLMTERQADRIRNFVVERLVALRAGKLPVPLVGRGRIVLHMIPLGALEPGSDILSTQDLRSSTDNLITISYRSSHPGVLTFDGLLRWDPFNPLEDDKHGSLATLYRSGIIEAVDGYFLESKAQAIPGQGPEQILVRVVDRYLQLLASAEVPLPVYLFLNLWGLQGRGLVPPDQVSTFGVHRMFGVCPFDRDHLAFPEVMVTDYGSRATELLRTTFDLLWNAVGVDRSPFEDWQRLGLEGPAEEAPSG